MRTIDIFRVQPYNKRMNLKENALSVLRAEQNYISGETLAERLNVTRQAVNKAVNALIAEGCKIESGKNRGYRLLYSALPDFARLRERFPQTDFLWRDKTDSTNAEAQRLYASGVRGRTAIFAKEQTAGKARYGGAFDSPAGGGLYVTLLDFPNIAPQEISAYSENVYEKTARALCCERKEFRLFTEGAHAGGMLVETISDPDKVLCAAAGIGVYLHCFKQDLATLAEEIFSALL